MNPKTTISLLVVVLAAVAVECQNRGDDRRRPGNRRPRPSLFNGDKYEWQVDLGSATLVDQKAFVNTEKNITVVITRDAVMAENNMTNSVALYDPSGMVAIKMIGARASRGRGVRPACFLTMATSSFDEIIADLTAINGTDVALSVDEVTLNATNDPLTRQEARAIFRTIRPLARFCRGSRLVQTSIVTGVSDDPDTEVKSTVTLEGQVNVIVKSRPTFPLPGDGNGRPRPGNGRPRPGNGRPSRPGNGTRFPRPALL